MSTVATTLGWLALAACSYYVLLYVLAAWRLRAPRPLPSGFWRPPLCVIVIPARNEELVIGRTIERAQALVGDPFLLVIDDGSDDDTARIARETIAPGRGMVLTREPEVAGRGKGDVLNAAAATIGALVATASPVLGGRTPDEVLVCILDADGWLDPDVLEHVAPVFQDPRVGGAQVSVRMWNARAGFLARMQDIEFGAYGNLFQAGRDVIGSVLMGGNGQFVRLSALQQLGPRPWTDCLTEDLDIGLRLVRRGWRLRACPRTWVAQQALVDAPRFLRQRTRWVQGHLTCWTHIPRLWLPSARIPLLARFDLTLHLLLGMYGLIAAAQLAVLGALAAGIASWHGVLPDAPPVAAASAVTVLMLIPVLLVALTYQRHAPARLPAAAAAGVLVVYCAYHYLWSIPATLSAVARIALRRRGWAKTRRTTISEHDLAAAALEARA